VTRLGALPETAGAIYRRIANRQWLACVLVCVLALGMRAALLPWLPVPVPWIADEFAFLLAGDTYASGRLTNPPHPMWQHFETLHVLQQPTYAAKYPPIQGLVLAFGQRLFHEPWIGVWLSTGIMCGAICWMLQAWISPGWALLGSLLAMMRLGVVSYWMNSFEGGCVAAIGGALLLGALPRMARARRLGHGMLFGLGLVILMDSRPFEGFVLAGASCIVLGWWLRTDRTPLREVLLRIVAPVVAVLIIGAAGTAYQNYRVTGNALELPYIAYDRQYAAFPNFIFAKARPDIAYLHPSIRDFWLKFQAGNHREAAEHPLTTLFIYSIVAYTVWFGWLPIAAAALLCPFPLRTREETITVALLVTSIASMLLITGFLPHYLAPITGLLFLRLAQSLKRVWTWKVSEQPAGLGLAILVIVSMAIPLPKEAVTPFPRRPDVLAFGRTRNDMIHELSRLPGKHLVLVRYGPNHDIQKEWVYNAADIDRSRVVWAQDMGPKQDSELIKYFSDRNVWLLAADDVPPRLTRDFER
jgi:hypothetical protein